MLLLEGPDGGGKTTLLRQMVNRWDIDVMDRMATTQGPKSDLYRLVFEDQVSRGKRRCGVYDRHSLISEYIYGPIMGRGIDPAFLSPSARIMRRQLSEDVLLILCLPPLDQVQLNVKATEQGKGVVANIEKIYEQYQLLHVTWPGEVIVHNYLHNYESPVWSRVPLHVTDWNRGK